MLFGKTEKGIDDFWRDYEEKTGEKVLARGLGQYVSGWEEFDSQGWTAIWGLIIATSGGFRFHHFPQQGWFAAITQFAGRDGQKEKTIFIPKETILKARLAEESRWWKKILSSPPPKLTIVYRDGAGNERNLLLEAGFKNDNLAEELNLLAGS